MNQIATLRIGDLLVCPKPHGLFSHVGVVAGSNTVFQNTPEKGEHLARVDEFSPGGAPVSVHRTGANPFAVMTRIQAALAAPKRYDLARRNCEHSAYEAVEGRPRSPQLAFWLVLAAIAGVVAWLVRR